MILRLFHYSAVCTFEFFHRFRIYSISFITSIVYIFKYRVY
nr:MAG TPA: hypothetical protein [Caudoviricetes sp.]